MRKCTFYENVAEKGSGGIDVGFLFFGNHLTSDLTGNLVTIDHCNMTANVAEYGGGTKLFSTRSLYRSLNNNVMFTDCLWEQNKARFGSAVEISPHACMHHQVVLNFMLDHWWNSTTTQDIKEEL